jgi:hypothetical protein
MKYKVLTANDEANAIRDRLRAAEDEHLRISVSLEAGIDGADSSRRDALEEAIKKLQGILTDAEKRANEASA